VFSDVLSKKHARIDSFCPMQNGSGYSILFIKSASGTSQLYHNNYNYFTSIQPFSLGKSRTLQIYPHIYTLWDMALAHIFDYTGS
jgi:hypothetical protein